MLSVLDMWNVNINPEWEYTLVFIRMCLTAKSDSLTGFRFLICCITLLKNLLLEKQ